MDLLFAAQDVPSLVLHAEICEDMWVPVPPSAEAALAGATVLVNLSGSPITVGRAEDRKLLCRSASSRCLAAYVYAAAGLGESTTDLSWDGQAMIYENGALLAETERFPLGDEYAVADVDLDLLRQERQRMGTFDDNRRTHRARTADFRTVSFELAPPLTDLGLRRRLERFPFVPADAERLAQDCYEAYNIQVEGLQQRLAAIGGPKVVIGVSGGLDSTHALIVAARAMDRAGRPRSDILAWTLPGFATSDHTKDNAHALMRAIGVTAAELDITPTARLMLKEMNHPFASGEPVYDVTFENVQAGLRTDYLFRLANQHNGIVLGTGDLSELALGWSTYGVGDQMSHYNVNSGVPKTLIQHLIRWVVSSDQFDEETGKILTAILDTEISPELVPGEEMQSTESKIGPYALHDFTLFHVLRYGFRPSKIAFLAWHAWHEVGAGAWPPGFPEAKRVAYDLPEIRRWLEVFCRRFFGFAQFKRSAMPNGPKVSAGGSLSPRGLAGTVGWVGYGLAGRTGAVRLGRGRRRRRWLGTAGSAPSRLSRIGRVLRVGAPGPIDAAACKEFGPGGVEVHVEEHRGGWADGPLGHPSVLQRLGLVRYMGCHHPFAARYRPASVHRRRRGRDAQAQYRQHRTGQRRRRSAEAGRQGQPADPSAARVGQVEGCLVGRGGQRRAR